MFRLPSSVPVSAIILPEYSASPLGRVANFAGRTGELRLAPAALLLAVPAHGRGRGGTETGAGIHLSIQSIAASPGSEPIRCLFCLGVRFVVV